MKVCKLLQVTAPQRARNDTRTNEDELAIKAVNRSDPMLSKNIPADSIHSGFFKL
mgnify:CR=1 FL=1